MTDARRNMLKVKGMNRRKVGAGFGLCKIRS